MQDVVKQSFHLPSLRYIYIYFIIIFVLHYYNS
jgi:hypothetical protein